MNKNVCIPLWALFSLSVVISACGDKNEMDSLNDSNSPAVSWQKTLGGTGRDVAYSIQQTIDGGYVVAGYANSRDGDLTDTDRKGGHDSWITKLDASGNLTWQKILGGDGQDHAYSIQETTDGGYIIAGHTGFNYSVTKLDVSGDLTWQKTFGGSKKDEAQSIQQTTDGGYVVAGYSYSSDGDVTGSKGSSDFWITKLDASGNLTWQKTVGGTLEDEAQSIWQTNDGGYVVAGHTFSSDGDVTGSNGFSDFWITKLDASGNLTWQKTFGGSEYEYANSIQQTTDGGYVVAGTVRSFGEGDAGFFTEFDYWILKLDESGNMTWQKTFGGSGNDVAWSIQQTIEGGYVVAGHTGSSDGDVTDRSGGHDFWIVKLDESGELTWQKTIGGTLSESAYSIQQTSDEGYVVAGFATVEDLPRYFIVKLEAYVP
ncbi:MAG: hypothetical protein ABJG47_16385 [Ekhidna sp.]